MEYGIAALVYCIVIGLILAFFHGASKADERPKLWEPYCD
jgi:hypothetical protein